MYGMISLVEDIDQSSWQKWRHLSTTRERLKKTDQIELDGGTDRKGDKQIFFVIYTPRPASATYGPHTQIQCRW
jgi:hypothetical protein